MLASLAGHQSAWKRAARPRALCAAGWGVIPLLSSDTSAMSSLSPVVSPGWCGFSPALAPEERHSFSGILCRRKCKLYALFETATVQRIFGRGHTRLSLNVSGTVMFPCA